MKGMSFRWPEPFTLAAMALILAVLPALGGCGSDGKETAALALTPVPSGKARISIHREDTIIYAGCPAAVKANGADVASIASGGKALFDVPAGDLVLAASCWTYPGDFAIRFKAEPGRTYAFALGPRQEGIATGLLLGVVGTAIQASISENTGAFSLKAAGGGTAPQRLGGNGLSAAQQLTGPAPTR